MRPSRLMRILIVPALALPVGAASLAFAGPAFAGAVVCTGLSGNATGTPAPTLTGCNDTANTGGTGTATGPLTSPATISWATSGGTNKIKFTDKAYTSGKKDKCLSRGTGYTYATIKGSVIGHTGTGSSVSGKVSAKVCVAPDGTLSLQSGTFKL